MKDFRPYQITDANRILACLQRDLDPLYVLPTGGGKTTVFTGIIGNRIADSWHCAIFVHRVELLKQASERLFKMGIQHGIIAPAGEFEYEDGTIRRYDGQLTSHQVHVASIDTVAARLDSLLPWLKRLDLGIPDEAHHSVAPKWQAILELLRRRLGVTATPCRTDGKGLGDTGLFKQLVIGPSIADLTEMGYLAPGIVYAPPTGLDLSKVGKSRGDYKLGATAALVDNEEFTKAARTWYARICPGQPAVAFCTTVEHAQHVAEIFRRAGWRSASVDGTMSGGKNGERTRVIKGLADGSVQVLTSCDLIGEGLDIPAVSAAMLLRPTASTGLCLQQIGRSLRPHEDKTNATVIDLVGNTMRHGMFDADRQWDLNGGVKGLERIVDATWRCRKCHRVQSKPKGGFVMQCGCGSRQKASGFASASIDNHPPIAGVPAEKLMRMKFQDAVACMKTKDDLVAYGVLRKFENPTGWAHNVMMRRIQMRARYQSRSVSR